MANTKLPAREPREFQLGLGDILSTIPHIFGIRSEESPRYEVLSRHGAYEIRRYASYLVAETEVIASSYKEGVATAFMRLANFIFGKNSRNPKASLTARMLHVHDPQSGERIEMTTPVLQEKKNFGWKMAFTLPSRFTFASAPKPLDSEIQLREVPIKTMAALSFRGISNQNKIDEKTAELAAAIIDDGRFQIISTAICAQYDPPTTIPFLRKNEILVEVEKVH